MKRHTMAVNDSPDGGLIPLPVIYGPQLKGELPSAGDDY